jgi:hypothetical protein
MDSIARRWTNSKKKPVISNGFCTSLDCVGLGLGGGGGSRTRSRQYQQLTDIQVFPFDFYKYHYVSDRLIIAIFIIDATMTGKKYPKSTPKEKSIPPQ